MRKLVATLGAVMILSISLAVGSVDARTPTPTPTATATETPASTPTGSADQTARFVGSTFLDAQLTSAQVTAQIGDVLCGEGQRVWNGLLFDISVVSADVKAGCGYEGATITFFLDGQPAWPMQVWHGGGLEHTYLIVGGTFSQFESTMVYDDYRGYLQKDYRVGAYVDGQNCTASFMWDSFYQYDHRFWLSVYSRDQKPGCGYEGATVSFKVLDGQGRVVAISSETRVWHSVEPEPRVVPTGSRDYFMVFTSLGNIGIGDVGAGDAEESGGSPVGVAALGLAIVGVAAFVAGAAIRKRATSIANANGRET